MERRGICADVEPGEDTVHVYEDGYQIEYHGIRDPETFVSWVMEVTKS